MTALQIATLTLVAIGGTAVVLTPVPLSQTLVLAIYGFALTALFFSFQAPDVALSEIVVSGIGLPLIILSALRKLAEDNEGRGEAAGVGASEHATAGDHQAATSEQESGQNEQGDASDQSGEEE